MHAPRFCVFRTLRSFGKLGENGGENSIKQGGNMSHSLCNQTHSTTVSSASNVSPLHQSGSTTVKIAPVRVVVNWSESKHLDSIKEWSFYDFETQALKVALENPFGGYYKTNVTVFFDNGHSHSCRLDLGCGSNVCGFSDHCFRVREYAYYLKQTNQKHWYVNDPQGLELLVRIQSYELNRQVVASARCEILRVTRLAKEQEALEKKQKSERDKQQAQSFRQQEEVFHASINVPAWAKSVIVATYSIYDEERSDPCSDYYQSKTTKTIVLAWSKHTRNLFTEMRKACLNHQDTAFLSDKENSQEHRENYSMGAGTYLTNKDYLRHGWEVRKIKFWNEEQKAKYVPVGELAEAVKS